MMDHSVQQSGKRRVDGKLITSASPIGCWKTGQGRIDFVWGFLPQFRNPYDFRDILPVKSANRQMASKIGEPLQKTIVRADDNLTSGVGGGGGGGAFK